MLSFTSAILVGKMSLKVTLMQDAWNRNALVDAVNSVFFWCYVFKAFLAGGMAFMAGAGVTQVVHRCEAAKLSGNLDLSECRLTCVPNAVYFLLNGFEVYSLSLRGNVLKSFPKKVIEKFGNLIAFSIENNALEEIPQEVANWKVIEGLNISKNKLSSFPEALYSVEQLIVLDLSDNKITELDVERVYGSFPKLTQLNLTGNPLTAKTMEHLLDGDKKPKLLKLILE